MKITEFIKKIPESVIPDKLQEMLPCVNENFSQKIH